MKINTNKGFAGYQIQKNQQELASSLKKLSTGKRINSAADDASGMVIANKLSNQASSFSQAIRNASDAISIVQVADGALGQAQSLVEDIRVKAIQAASAAQSPASLKAIQADIAGSLEAIENIAENTSFNGQKLLSGAFDQKSFQIGASSNETITLSIGSVSPEQVGDSDIGSLTDIDVTTFDGAQDAIAIADAALEYISGLRSQVGAAQNQLSSAINNLSNSRINTLAAESEIRDVDYAEESMNLNKLKILGKAKTFAQAQANNISSKIIDIIQ